MAEVYSQDINVKTDIKGLPKNSDALAKLTTAVSRNAGVVAGLTQALQKAGNKAVGAASNTLGSTQKLAKPLKELEQAGVKAGAALHSLTSKMKEFGFRVKENWYSFKKLMGIMKSVALVGGAMSVVFGALVAVMARAQSKKREATASHFMSPAKLDALKYAEADLGTDGQVLQMLDSMGQAVLDPENYGAFKQLGIDPERFRKLDAKGRLEYAAPALKQRFQGMSDADISKNDLVFKPFAQIAGDPSFGRQMFGTRDAAGIVHGGDADKLSKHWSDRLAYSSKIDYTKNAATAELFHTALNNLQITFDTLAAKATPAITDALKALDKVFKQLEPTILKLIDKLPYFIDQLAKFLQFIGISLLSSDSSTKLQQGKSVEISQSAEKSLLDTAKSIGLSAGLGAGAGAAVGSVVPVAGTAVGGVLGAATGSVYKLFDTLMQGNKTGSFLAPTKQKLDDVARAAVMKHKDPSAKLAVPKSWDAGSIAWNSNTEADFLLKLSNSLAKMVSEQSGKDVKALKISMELKGNAIWAKVTDTSTNTILYNEMLGGK